jgi:hypothetical protein
LKAAQGAAYRAHGLAAVGLSSGGAVDLFVHVNGTDVIIDIAGYVM